LKLYNSGTLKAFLKKHGIATSKGLGQHFLCSQAAVEAIVAEFSAVQGVCEIGPGPGVLTSPLSIQCGQVIALEVDTTMLGALKDSSPKADVRVIDALEADLCEILSELPEPRGIVSNLPYYITGPLINRIADARGNFSIAVLMMQREVANRILSKPGNRERGSLSVYLQTIFDMSLVVHVPAKDFMPPPKVDSTVLRFIPKSFDVDAEFAAFYFKTVRMGFAQPRKTLANNLIAGFHIEREQAADIVERADLEEKVRPHDMTQAEWLKVATILRETISSV
jgi:16S rRNA (adenine1518-N6/adenine1519-N6)-dimethyltransferase